MSEAALHRIIYVSRATQPFDRAALDQLAVAAVSRNEKEAISGALIHSVGYFLQWFEGPEPAVTALWQRLNADARHSALRTLANGPIPTRRFQGWAMLRLFDQDGDVDREAPLATLGSAGVASRLFELSLPRLLRSQSDNR